jgi:hypothetical protein
MGGRGAIKTPNYGDLVNLGKKIELSAEKVPTRKRRWEWRRKTNISFKIHKSLNHSQPIWSGQPVPLKGLGHEMNIFVEGSLN